MGTAIIIKRKEAQEEGTRRKDYMELALYKKMSPRPDLIAQAYHLPRGLCSL